MRNQSLQDQDQSPQALNKTSIQLPSKPLPKFVDHRPQTKKAIQLQKIADQYSQQKSVAFVDNRQKNTPAQLQQAHQKQPIQQKEQANKTGLPDQLKSGIETLSGYTMDDVKVHRNSSKPAQLKAHAYAQGSDIHLSPGQEKHLPHEAWHVVQQKQGRVKPTVQMKGKTAVNDDAGLEKEADVMGQQALKMRGTPSQELAQTSSLSNTLQLRENKDEMDEGVLMESLQRVSGDSCPFYRTDENGALEMNEGELAVETLTQDKRIHVLNTVENPHEDLQGRYVHIKYLEADVNQEVVDKIDIVSNYGYVHEDQLEATGEYKDSGEEIKKKMFNRRKGKILPTSRTDPKISHKDVFQSGISDCYLEAAMISLVQSNPNQIKRLFSDYAGDSVTVTFPAVGDKEELSVTMNKNLFLNDQGEPIYGGKKDRYLWPAFIQKAWAIDRGKYGNVPMGQPHDALERLTGQAYNMTDNILSTRFGDHSPRRAYKEIVAALKTKQPVVLSTSTWTDKGPANEEGVQPNVIPKAEDHGGLGIVHTYAVLGISTKKLDPENFDAKNTHAIENTQVTLRDPREKTGKTFKLKIIDIVNQRKISHLTFGKADEEE